MHESRKHLIYLTGFMGSGKSTIGPILANSLGYEYCDLDRMIEGRTGKTIADIFAGHGERFFRELEHSYLLEISTRNDCVVALGGGTISHGENLSVVKTSGILVYLKLSQAEAVRRLKNKTDRPLLRSAGGLPPSEEELRNRVDSLLSKREPDYTQADITITTEKRVGKTVDELVSELKPYLR